MAHAFRLTAIFIGLIAASQEACAIEPVFSQLSGSKPADFCEFMPISKGFSLTWRSLANGMFGDAKINQDKTPAG